MPRGSVIVACAFCTLTLVTVRAQKGKHYVYPVHLKGFVEFSESNLKLKGVVKPYVIISVSSPNKDAQTVHDALLIEMDSPMRIVVPKGLGEVVRREAGVDVFIADVRRISWSVGPTTPSSATEPATLHALSVRHLRPTIPLSHTELLQHLNRRSG